MTKMNFKDLVVWQRSVDLVPRLYGLLRQFPKEETYALSDQIHRAAVSVPANIAEVQARQQPRDFLQYLSIAKGSLAEIQLAGCCGHRVPPKPPHRSSLLCGDSWGGSRATCCAGDNARTAAARRSTALACILRQQLQAA